VTLLSIECLFTNFIPTVLQQAW